MQEKKNCSQTVNSAKFYRSVLNQGITAEKFSSDWEIFWQQVHLHWIPSQESFECESDHENWDI